MNCCPGCPGDPRTQHTGAFFSAEATKYARRFEKRGPDTVQTRMLESLDDQHVTGRSLLDIGCGVGALHLSLLQRGARTAQAVDLAPEMLAQARVSAQRRGLAEKVQHLEGDFVQLTTQIAEADITMLDKVVCCYHDINSILDRSLEVTRDRYILSFPRAHVAVAMRLFTWLSTRLLGGFHPFVHDWAAMRQRIAGHGFREYWSGRTLNWNIAAYRR